MKIAIAIAKGIALAAIAIVIAEMSSCRNNDAVPVPPHVASTTPGKVDSPAGPLGQVGAANDAADVQAALAAERLAKVQAEPNAARWLAAGGKIAVVSWRKAGERGKRKLWTARTEWVKAVNAVTGGVL